MFIDLYFLFFSIRSIGINALGLLVGIHSLVGLHAGPNTLSTQMQVATVSLIRTVSTQVPADVAPLPLQAVPSPSPQRMLASPVTVAPSDPDFYKSWIYNEESGNSPTRDNAEGCLGLGQACPGSKLLAVCPDESYGCEDAFFTSYMLSRYGTWYSAYVFHIANGWW